MATLVRDVVYIIFTVLQNISIIAQTVAWIIRETCTLRYAVTVSISLDTKYSVEEVVEHVGFGNYQILLLFVAGFSWVRTVYYIFSHFHPKSIRASLGV